MSSLLYYFSGRGNSLRVARDLSQRLDHAEIRFMGKQSVHTIDKIIDCIGIITPVIDFGIPAYVLKFIKMLKVEGANPYVFCVVTCGGMPGASMLQLEKALKKKGLRMNAGFTIKFGLEEYTDADWKTMLDDMSSIIRSRSVKPAAVIPLKDKLMTFLLNSLVKLTIPREDKKFMVNDSCNGCGVCARICPVGNIRIESGKPAWDHKCEQCAACFAWCPKEAVYGTSLAARTHYRNPHVSLDQILNYQECSYARNDSIKIKQSTPQNL